MSAHLRYLKIGVAVVAWSGVLLAATYRSHTPVVFGRYSWGYIVLLGLLVVVALTLSLATSTWYQPIYQARTGLVISGVSFILSLGAFELALMSDFPTCGRTVFPFNLSMRFPSDRWV